MDIVATEGGIGPGWVYGVSRLCVAGGVRSTSTIWSSSSSRPCYNGNSMGTAVLGFGPQKLDSERGVSRKLPLSRECASISICNRRHETKP